MGKNGEQLQFLKKYCFLRVFKLNFNLNYNFLSFIYKNSLLSHLSMNSQG